MNAFWAVVFALVVVNVMVIIALMFRKKAQERALQREAVEAAKAYQRAIIDEAAKRKIEASQKVVEGIANADEQELIDRARDLASGVRRN